MTAQLTLASLSASDVTAESECGEALGLGRNAQTSVSLLGSSADEVRTVALEVDSRVTVPTLVIVVHGIPAPQGSKNGFAIKKGGHYTGKVAQVESSKKVKPWRQDVVAAAQDAMPDIGWIAFDGPLAVRMVFSFTRPKSHYRTGRNAHLLRDDAPCQPCTIPDLSKLCRATEDALTTSRTWADDARVAEYDRLAKVWCDSDPEALSTTGCRIEIRQIRGAR